MEGLGQAKYEGQIRGGLDAGTKTRDTLPQLLDEIEKLAYMLRDSAESAANNLDGAVPSDVDQLAKNPGGGTIMDKARTIRYVLNTATGHQRRAMNALAL